MDSSARDGIENPPAVFTRSQTRPLCQIDQPVTPSQSVPGHSCFYHSSSQPTPPPPPRPREGQCLAKLALIHNGQLSDCHPLQMHHLRSRSRWPDCVMRRPPRSSSCSRTPSCSSACITLRSTLRDASTWRLGREPRFLAEPCALAIRPTPTVLRRYTWRATDAART